MKTKQYSIKQLCEKTGFSRRTVRYYIQKGVLDPPAGRGRGGFYFDTHLAKLQQIKAYQEKGLRLSEIQNILSELGRPEPDPAREVWVKYPIKPGIEIHLRRDLEETERKRVLKILRIAKEILQGGSEND